MTRLLEKTIINLSDCETTAQALNKFEGLLFSNNYSNKNLSVVLGKLVFTHGHMARLKSLSEQNNTNVETVYTTATQTQLAGLNIGLLVSEKAPGDELLENFKKSLQPDDEMIVVSDNTEAVIDNVTDKSIVENNIITEEAINSDGQIFSTAETDGIVLKSVNDVVEILNEEDVMVQQKIDLPFEAKKDITDNFVVQRNNKDKETTTLYIHQTLRSGQIIAHDGNVVIAGDTHPGSEIIAGGDIIVWGTLGGIAHAGCNGNYKVSIRALKLNAIQIRIADFIARRPDFNNDFSKELVIKPEVARIANGEIKIFSLK